MVLLLYVFIGRFQKNFRGKAGSKNGQCRKRNSASCAVIKVFSCGADKTVKKAKDTLVGKGGVKYQKKTNLKPSSTGKNCRNLNPLEKGEYLTWLSMISP
jgi:hypothetical protein